MYNYQQYNNWAFNQKRDFIAWVTSYDDIVFNWLGLQNENITTSFKDDDNLPMIQLIDYQNPLIDWGGILNKRYSEKKITLSWRLKSDTAEWLNNLIDIFKEKTSVTEWYLYIRVNGAYRRTKATVVGSDILNRNHYNITAVQYRLQLITLEPFFYDMNGETITEEGIVGNTSIEFQYTGTAWSDLRLYMIFNQAADVDEIILSMNDRQISIDALVSAWDVLYLDWKSKSITINWTEVDYTGAFPRIKYGSNLLDINITGTFDVDTTILYEKNYL